MLTNISFSLIDGSILKSLNLQTHLSDMPEIKIIENTSEIGMYEHDIFKIKINKHIDRASEKIQISNPIIKEEDLYTIL